MSTHADNSGPPQQPELSQALAAPTNQPGSSKRRLPSIATLFQWTCILALGLFIGRSFMNESEKAPAGGTKQLAQEGPQLVITERKPSVPPPGQVNAPRNPALLNSDMASVLLPHTAEEQAALTKLSRAHARSARQNLIDLAEDTKTNLERCQAELRHLNDARKTIFSDEVGKKVAASRDLVSKVRAVLKQEVALPTIAITELKAQVSDIILPLQAAQSDPNSDMSPPGSFKDTLNETLTKACDATEAYTKLASELDAIIDEAKTLAEKPAAIGLKFAIEQLNRDDARRRVEKVTKAYDDATNAGDDNIAKEKAAQIAATKKRELDALIAEGIEKKKRDEAEIAARLAKEKLERELVYIRSPEGSHRIQNYLQPFIAPGYSYPQAQQDGSAGSISSVKDSKKGPVSLSLLISLGALNDTKEGLIAISRSANNSYNDRPRWQVEDAYLTPFYSWRPRTIEFLKTAQGLLRDYGNAMVEDGLLAK